MGRELVTLVDGFGAPGRRAHFTSRKRRAGSGLRAPGSGTSRLALGFLFSRRLPVWG